MAWQFIGGSYGLEPFMIDGVNVWGQKWKQLKERATVVDPLYGRAFQFEIWAIEAQDKQIRFAAGEFSNCAWGFYIEQPTTDL